jgi:butyrate kinase
MLRVLVINVGSTSVKLALFQDERQEYSVEVTLARKADFSTIGDISSAVRGFLADSGRHPGDLDAVAARGGPLRPVPGGTYVVNQEMLDDLKSARFGMHASNLSAVVADEIAREASIHAYVVDPVTVDELADEARFTGIPSIRRRSIFHALSQKAAARRASAEIGKKYDESSLVVVHMGGGITIGAHVNGRVVDVNNGLDGDGPITPERAGTIPAGSMAELCFSGEHTHAKVKKMLTGNGGMFAYFGTNDMRLVDEKIQSGDPTAESLLKAMAYSIAKEIGSMSAVLCGNVDAIVFTGGLVRWSALMKLIEERIDFLGPIMVYPDNLEMAALAEGVLRVLRGEEQAQSY